MAAEVWLPIENVNEEEKEVEAKATCSKINLNEEGSKRPTLERTISGKRAHTTINCDHLPQLILNVSLPETYPSDTMPNYTLSCVWLSKSQLRQLCAKLDEIWRENEHMSILYTWIDWLQSNLISHLDIFETPNKIIITPLNDFFDDESSSNDKRAVSTYANSDDLIYQFLRYNYVEELKEFRNNMQSCLICFEEKLGAEFFRLSKCKHHFCSDCMSSMCQMHVKEGTIQLIQ